MEEVSKNDLENLGGERGRFLYPKRPFFGLEEKIHELKDLEFGRGEKIKLTEKERSALFSFDDELGTELEKFFAIGVLSAYVYPEYFLSEEGRQKGKEFLNIDFSVCSSESDVVKKIFSQKENFSQESLKEVKKVFARSESYMEDKLFGELLPKISEAGDLIEISSRDIGRKEIVFNEKELEEKNNGVRNFKQKLKDIYRKFQSEGNSIFSNFELAQKTILEIYLKRANQILAELGPKIISLTEQRILSGDDSRFKYKRKMKNISRYDKFIFGTENSFSKEGEKRQTGNVLDEYANWVEEESLKESLNQEENIRQKGLDEKIIFEKDLEKNFFTQLAEELLDFYGQKSVNPASEYDPTKNGPASDNKWRFVVDENRRSMEVNLKNKVILSGTENKSVVEVISVLLGHEIEGHFVQALNRSKVPLKIFEKMGGDRSAIFSEGGAMLVQDTVSSEAFGLKVIPNAHYIRAMKRRLEGGDYFDCLKVFYQSAIKIPQIKRRIKKINEEAFKKEIEAGLKLAINRTKRLFRGGADLSSKEAFLSSSKDTVYLEQKKLLDKLKTVGLEKYAFVGGMNIDTVISLIKIGVLKSEEIVAPKYYSLQIWDRIKKNYEIKK